MINTKIYNVLRHFNKYEQNKLRKFLESPYFNSDSTLVSIFDLIVSFQNSGSKKEFTNEFVWKKIFKKTVYDDVRFRKYSSDLLKIVESFLAVEFMESDKITKSYMTLNAIKNRKIENLYRSFTKSSKTLIDNNEDQSATQHLNQYLVEKTLYELTESELKRLDKSNIESISGSLDTFYFSEKLRFYSAALSQKGYIKDGYKIDFIEDFLASLKKSQIFETPSISIYYYCLMTVKESDNTDYYYKLKEQLSLNAIHFPKSEALSLYYFAANYCIRRHNRGDWEFGNELFEIYKDMVEKRIILSSFDEIAPWNFKNIVGIGVFLKKFEWTEQFIRDFGDKIPIQYRDNSIRFNLGQLFFAQKKYDDVLEQLRDLEYEDLLASLNAKTYTTITYFELDEIDLLFSYIESFRVYLGRKTQKKELNKERQQRYLSFLNLVKKISKIIPRDKKALDKFEFDLNKEKQHGVVGAKWLTEKLEELKS